MKRLYRPSNGTEGEGFMDEWCYRCANDDVEGGCRIVADTMAYKADDPRYPKRWWREDGVPWCDAFLEKK